MTLQAMPSMRLIASSVREWSPAQHHTVRGCGVCSNKQGYTVVSTGLQTPLHTDVRDKPPPGKQQAHPKRIMQTGYSMRTPVIILTVMPALCATLIASTASSRGGSRMATISTTVGVAGRRWKPPSSPILFAENE